VVWQALNLIHMSVERVPITNGDNLRAQVDAIIEQYETLPVVKPFDVFDKAMSLFHLLKSATNAGDDEMIAAEEHGNDQITTFKI
jgi:hypothetical protein